MGSRYGLEIRAANATDAGGIAALLAASGEAVDPQRLGARLEALRQDGATVLLAVAWGPPSGLVVMHRHRSLASDLPVARIDALLVDPEERRKGIGRLLVKAAAQAARVTGCGLLCLEVAANRPGLAEFCAATGFAPGGATFERPLRKRS